MTKGLKFKMLPVEDFCEYLDTEKVMQTDFLAMFKENDSMSTFKKRYDELSTGLKQQYLQLKKKYLDYQYNRNWRKVISDHMEYKKI